MRLLRTEHFKKDFKRLPREVQEKLPGVLEKFIENQRHPSLHTKKMQGVDSIWEMRLSNSYRLTFELSDEAILLRRIGTHDILRNP